MVCLRRLTLRLAQQVDEQAQVSCTGTRHQSQTVQTYDADGDVLTTETKDLLGGDPARKVTNSYDDYDRLRSAVDPDGNEVTYTYDVFGNKMSMVDPNGDRYEYAYTARNAIAEVRLRDSNSTGDGGYTVLSSTAYDFAGRVVQQTDAEGRTVVIEYFHDDLVAKTKEARDMYIAIAMTWDALATQMEDQAERLKLDETLQLWGPALPQRPTERK